MEWPAAFALTCAVELPIVALVAVDRRRRAALDAFGANLLTHPLAWYSVRSLLLSWLAVELAVLAVEAVVYRTVTRLSWARALLAACLSNGVTAALSFVV